MVDGPPIGVTGDMVPVVLPRIGAIVPNGLDGGIVPVLPGKDA